MAGITITKADASAAPREAARPDPHRRHRSARADAASYNLARLAKVRSVTAARALDGWAGAATAVILGGDTNTRRPRAGDLQSLGGHDVDFVLARGWRRVGRVTALDHESLSDHAPVLLHLEALPASRDDVPADAGRQPHHP
jgi:hypothetical protein